LPLFHVLLFHYFDIHIFRRHYISLLFRAIFITPLRFSICQAYAIIEPLRHFHAATFSFPHFIIAFAEIFAMMPPPLPFRHYYDAFITLIIADSLILILLTPAFSPFHAIFIEFR
jgi:hypothetical protein